MPEKLLILLFCWTTISLTNHKSALAKTSHECSVYINMKLHLDAQYCNNILSKQTFSRHLQICSKSSTWLVTIRVIHCWWIADVYLYFGCLAFSISAGSLAHHGQPSRNTLQSSVLMTRREADLKTPCINIMICAGTDNTPSQCESQLPHSCYMFH